MKKQSTPFSRFLRRQIYNQIIYLSKNCFFRQRFSSDLQWKCTLKTIQSANNEFTPLTSCALFISMPSFWHLWATRHRVSQHFSITCYQNRSCFVLGWMWIDPRFIFPTDYGLSNVRSYERTFVCNAISYFSRETARSDCLDRIRK